MKTRTKLLAQTTLLFLITFTLATVRAQVTATWTNVVEDEWNTASDWDQEIVPGVGTNVVINAGAIVDYNLPMAAPSIGTIALSGILNVNASGFDIDGGSTNPVANSLAGGAILNITSSGSAAIMDISNSPALTIAATGALTNSGSLLFSNTGPISLANIGSPGNAITLNSGAVFTMTNTIGSTAINVGANSSSQGAVVLINGGTMTLDKLISVAGTSSAVFINGGTVNFLGGSRINDTSNDGSQRFQVNNANVNLGNFSVFRSKSTGGLLASNSVINATGIQIGTGNSAAFATIANGAILTNSGIFTISDNTNAASGSTDRRAQFLIRGGGTVVATGANGIIIANQSNTNPAVGIANTDIGGVLDMSSGSLTAPQITLIKDTTISNAYARLNLSGSATIYLGSGGLVANTGVAHTAFNIAASGGTFAATADWSSSAPMTISNTVTFRAADALSTPHNITLSGVLSAIGTLNKIGNGTLTLNAADTYSGNTLVNAGTLAIGASGSILNSSAIVVASGATLDATALPAGLSINSAKTLQGLGTVLGTVNVASGGIVNPGSNTVTGTLTIGSLVENGGATYNYFAGTGPNPDLLVLSGDLDVTNVNNIQINGDLAGNTAYPLIEYAGNFNGGVSNFSVVGATGFLSNNVTSKTIYLVTANPLRNPTNVVWVGNAANNVWDTTTSSNWLNQGHPDFFVPGDNARFDSTGATNPLVNIPGSVTPGSVTVDTTSNYTFFGVGNIGGVGGLTKTNSGTLTVMSTNSYSGQTIVSGGVLEVTNLGSSGSPSSIGAAGTDPTNLIITDSIFRYIGTNNASTDHGATLGDVGGTIDLPSSGVTLTLNGVLEGTSLTETGLGTLTLNAANTYTNVTVQSGTLALENANAAGNGSVTNEDGTSLRVIGALTVQNAIDVEGTVIVDLNNTGGNTALDGAWSGSGTVIITNQNNASGRTFTMGGNGLGGGSMDNFSGTIECGTSPQIIRFNDGGGTFNFGSTNMTLDLGTSTAVFTSRNGSATINIGALMGGPDTILSGHAANGTAGSLTYSIGGKGLSTEFDGSITNSANNDMTAITLVGGALRLTGETNDYTGDTTVNAGTLQVDGQIIASTISVFGGELTGNGILGGPVAIGPGATFVPGDGLGVLTISNALSLAPSSTNFFELDATLGTNSSVAGLADVTYGGNLIVSNISGTLTDGQTFTLFSSASYAGGNWDSITLPSLGAGLQWDTSQLTVNGSITVRGQLQITSVKRVPGNIILNGINGSLSGTYYVLSTTNLTVPIIDWTPLSTNTFNPDGSFSVTNPIDPTVPHEFYILQDVGP